MKVRVGNVVFEDFDANELDTVITKLRSVGLLGTGVEMVEDVPAPRPIQRPMPAPRPVPIQVTAPAPVPAPALRPIPVPAPRLAPQTTLPQAPVPPKSSESEEEESKSSGWL